MAAEVVFVSLDGLEECEKERILKYIDPLNRNPFVELPWENIKTSFGSEAFRNEFATKAFFTNINALNKGNILNVDDYADMDKYSGKCEQGSPTTKAFTKVAGLNVFAAPFTSFKEIQLFNQDVTNNSSFDNTTLATGLHSIKPFVKLQGKEFEQDIDRFANFNKMDEYESHDTQLVFSKPGILRIPISSCSDTPTFHHKAPFPNNGRSSTNSKSSPVPCLDSANFPGLSSNLPSVNSNHKLPDVELPSLIPKENSVTAVSMVTNNFDEKADVPIVIDINSNKKNTQEFRGIVKKDINENDLCKEKIVCESDQPKGRSFADVLRSKNRTLSNDLIKENISLSQDKKTESIKGSNDYFLKSGTFNISDDKLAVSLGKYFYQLQLDFSPMSLQPCGLINRRNWCYVHATLQALLACPPFCRLLRNMPCRPSIDREKSSTPVIDSMTHLVHKFQEIMMSQDDFQPGTAFHPTEIYNMLENLKPHCLMGQQEDAEEFLSLLINDMHEEMIAINKNYAKIMNFSTNEDTNGHHEDGDEEEWQTIGVKQRSMITRKVVEHKTPISDLLGGQTVNLLTTPMKTTTTASVQPFFTLQLDIQADNVNTLEDALSQMTVKESVQGYTCPISKQEVEAYCKILLKKLPPILILHLKRFVYDKDGGCKKVMKYTQYPLTLELKKELFSSEMKKKKPPYHLFAVVYHEGEEAIKGHYICDVYHYGYQCWIRCDDRNISVISDANVLTHSPPRVPYLLFYRVNNPEPEKV